jgi:hypothetical protein
MQNVAAEGRMVFSAGRMNSVIEAQYRLMDPSYEPPKDPKFVCEHSTMVSAWGQRPVADTSVKIDGETLE